MKRWEQEGKEGRAGWKKKRAEWRKRHKEQPREDRTLLGRGWPERRLRQSVAVDKWGERGCIQFEGDSVWEMPLWPWDFQGDWNILGCRGDIQNLTEPSAWVSVSNGIPAPVCCVVAGNRRRRPFVFIPCGLVTKACLLAQLGLHSHLLSPSWASSCVSLATSLSLNSLWLVPLWKEEKSLLDFLKRCYRFFLSRCHQGSLYSFLRSCYKKAVFVH